MSSENYIRGDSMPTQAKSTNQDGSLEKFSKSEESEDEDKQYIFYNCRNCGGRHAQGEKPCRDGGESGE